MRPAPELVRRVEAVPTIFPDFDRVVGVGGLPTRRIIVVHGESNKGKTAFTLGLGLSFLRRDHFFALADLEQTTPEDWLSDLYGDAFRHPGFVAMPTGTFEQVRDAVRDYFERIARARDAGDLPPETRSLLLVDSIKKLTPKAIWDELQKAAKADADEAKVLKGGRKQKVKTGVDGMGGRAGQIKAAFMSAWLDELVPLLAQTLGSVVLIARERVTVEGAGQFEKEVIELGGGTGVNFDASLRLRVGSRPMYEGDEGKKQYVGEKHTVDVMKTKVHAKEEQVPQAIFHSSNGLVSPAGFDHARDLLACALELGVVTIGGSYYNCENVSNVDRLGQGIDKSLAKLRSNAEISAAVDAACRVKMVAASPSA